MKLKSIARRITGTTARIVRTVADAPRVSRELREHRAAQTRAAAPRTPAPLGVGDVEGEVPAVADIESAARAYERAREDTNAAARAKRGAEKVLKRTPDGVYGAVVVERFESSRLVADLDAVKALLELHGLGDVPMKRCGPSLTITWADEATASVDQVAEFAVAA